MAFLCVCTQQDREARHTHTRTYTHTHVYTHTYTHTHTHLRGREALPARLDPGVGGVIGLDDLVGDQLDHVLHLLVGELAPDEPLHRVQRVLRVGHGLMWREA
jgi:hypothetical protein